MINYFLLADSHFQHQMLIDKGFRPEDFEQRIFDSLKVVKGVDILIHLGDFCIGNDELCHQHFFNELHPDCRRILVKGNHDNKSNTWYYNQGWDFVCEAFSLHQFGVKMLFSHEPVPEHGLDLNIHGHWHDAANETEERYLDWYNHDKYKCLALEQTDFKPVNLRTWINK